MAEINSRFNPSFSLFPINNNRTGYQPVNLPIVLVVPYRRTASGQTVGDTGVFDVKFAIEDAPGQAKVAGFENQGILVPNLERFRIEIDSRQLAEVRHDATGDFFFDQTTREPIDFQQAVSGDLFQFGLMRGPVGAFGQSGPGAIDTLSYFPDADYYDLSPFVLEVFDLPVGRYRVVWEASYYERVLSSAGEVICVDTSRVSRTRFAFTINHPGEIHEAMRSNTPEVYFSGNRRDRDPTIAFYRPFADALQDIFDEQELLKGINWIDKIPTQYIPYLAYLLGLDLPYFPSSTDNIRRSLLRNGRRLQQLKGSQRAIRELFEIFGFTIDLTNLWYSQDGSRFIGPNEQLPSDIENQEITTEDVCHSEPVLNSWNTSGFGQIEIPLLFRPLENTTIDAFLVERGSMAELQLRSIVNQTASDVEAIQSDRCGLDVDGFQTNTAFPSISGVIIGLSRVLISQRDGSLSVQQSGVEPVINADSVSYDFDRNTLSVTFDHYLNFEEEFSNRVVYIFATYERRKIILPPELADLRSNRFDINVLTFKDGERPTSDVFEFLIDFLFKFKAFHSLLRKIVFTVECNEVYNVQDFCLGGEFGESPNSDLGNLQIPPAVVPIEPTESVCQDVPSVRGFKDSDIAFRNLIRDGLEREHATWKNLDGTHQVPVDQLPLLQSLSRVQIRSEDPFPCEFTQFGQDRVLDNGNKDFDHTTDDRNKVCDLETNTDDYCYRGRVVQDVFLELNLALEEIFRCKPCGLSGGVGAYYLTRLIPMDELSGGGPGTDAVDLTMVENLRRSFHDAGYVRVMGFPQAEIHYTDRNYVDEINDTLNNRFFSARKPSLEVEKDNMFIPGHRFITMLNQLNDFTSNEYNFRPWDDIFQICPENAPNSLPELNPRLEVGTDGNDILIWDQFSWVNYGNGIPADIPQMDDHTTSPLEVNRITHSIWSAFDPGLCWSRGNNYGSDVECAIDQANPVDDVVTRYPLEAIGQVKTSVCFTDSLSPIFKSANRNCECPEDPINWIGESLENFIERDSNLTDGFFGPTDVTAQPQPSNGMDFLDGYPASYGEYNIDLNQFDFPREVIEGYNFSRYGVSQYGVRGGEVDLDFATAIGIPLLGTDGCFVTLRFKIGSGIRLDVNDPQYRHYEPLRMDCDCSFFDCPTDPTGQTGTGTEVTAPRPTMIMRCNEDLYVQPDGTIDYNCDQIETNIAMGLNERYGAQSCLMDGSIPNMLSFDPSKFTMGGVEGLPDEGMFQYIDDYGVQYVGMFETFNNRIDITTITKDPRCPGSLIQTGEVINRKVFRDGIVSMERQIIQTMDSGFMIIADGFEQEKTRFQTSFGCGDEVFEDPFEYHLDFQISDEVFLTPISIGEGGSGGS